jgi:hypothetical protein
MTSATTSKPGKPKNLTVVEIVAATLSAVSTAIAASFLGVTGTIVGAAVGSVLGTIATAFYAHSLTRGQERLRTLRPGARRRLVPLPDPAPVVGTVYGRRRRQRRQAWPIVLASTAAAFALGIGAITIGELAFGHPVSALFGKHTNGTTSIGNLPGGAATTPVGPVQTPADPTTSASTSATPSDEESGPARSPEPDAATSTTAPVPTTAPTPTQP